MALPYEGKKIGKKRNSPQAHQPATKKADDNTRPQQNKAHPLEKFHAHLRVWAVRKHKIKKLAKKENKKSGGHS
ncbi:MAG: hypothetical protein PHV34_19165 [Verrucomicrobiae bacterium]|nr:hypothetical protein [Verrucomicrobiae bacterium]